MFVCLFMVHFVSLQIGAFHSMSTRVSVACCFHVFCISQSRSYARCDMFRLGMTASSPASLMKLNPHRLK